MNIALVTDSTADIPKELLQEFNIYVIPNIVIIDGKSFQDGIDISRFDFYTHLTYMKTPPTTATASSGTYHQLYSKLFEQGVDTIVSIHVSQNLSGVFNAACAAANEFNNRVQVIDSQQVGR